MLDLYYKVYSLLSSERPRMPLIFCSSSRRTERAGAAGRGLGSGERPGPGGGEGSSSLCRAGCCPFAVSEVRLFLPNIPRQGAVCHCKQQRYLLFIYAYLGGPGWLLYV